MTVTDSGSLDPGPDLPISDEIVHVLERALAERPVDASSVRSALQTVAPMIWALWVKTIQDTRTDNDPLAPSVMDWPGNDQWEAFPRYADDDIPGEMLVEIVQELWPHATAATLNALVPGTVTPNVPPSTLAT